LGYF